MRIPKRSIFLKGQTVFEEGQRGHEAYIIETGKISVHKMVRGERVLLGELGPGDVFGEMALMDDSTRMASAQAEEDTICVVIGKMALQAQLQQAPAAVRVITRTLLNNIRNMGQDLAEAVVTVRARAEAKPHR